MPVIDDILSQKIAQWVIENSEILQNRSRFCAYNSIRFLRWADSILETAPNLANFAALHATEEAVASFISAAKAFGMREQARSLNLHDHKSKALISTFSQRLSTVLSEGKLAIAVGPKGDTLAFRIPTDDGPYYGKLHLSSFKIDSDKPYDGERFLHVGPVPKLEEIQREVARATEARNKILYATNKGIPTGFREPEAAMTRETYLSLSLIWAAIDLYQNPHQDKSFVKFILTIMSSFEGSK